MRRALLATLLAATAVASFGATPAELRRRSRSLLSRIRASAGTGAKDAASLQAELGALESENRDAADAAVAEELRQAEESLAAIKAGKPLPRPARGRSGGEADGPAGRAAASPSAASAPNVGDIASAVVPEVGARVFDGSSRAGAGAVRVPPPPPTADLGPLLALPAGPARDAFLLKASAGLLVALKAPDKAGARAAFLARRLADMLAKHPDRDRFVTLSLFFFYDKWMNVIYTLAAGGLVDQNLGKTVDWTTPRGARGGGRPR